MNFQPYMKDYDYHLRYEDDKNDFNRQGHLQNFEGKTVRHFNSPKFESDIYPSIDTNTFSDWIVRKCSIVEDAYFQGLVITLLVINTIQMGVATMDFVTDYDHTMELFYRIDMLFMTIFTLEIIMQFIHRGKALFDDKWLTTDCILVGSTWFLIITPFFREFRVIRAFRLIVKFKEMRNLITALIVATKKLFAVGMLLLLIFYTFGVIFTLLFKDLQEEGYTEEDYFSRLDVTLFTLFQFMTLDGWSDVTKEILGVYPWAWAPICTFIVISSFVVINLFIAVICDSVAEVQRKEFEQNIMQINSKLSMAEDNQAAEIFELECKVEKLTKVIMELRNDLIQQNDLLLHDSHKRNGFVSNRSGEVQNDDSYEHMQQSSYETKASSESNAENTALTKNNSIYHSFE